MRLRNHKKRVAAFFVIAVSIVMSTFILGSRTNNSEELLTKEGAKEGAYEEGSNFQFESGVLPSFVNENAEQASPAKTTGNLTNALIKSYLQRLSSGGGDTLPSEEDLVASLEDLISEGLQDIQIFAPSDIIVSPDSSSISQITYVETFDAIFRKHFDWWVNRDDDNMVIAGLVSFFENDDPAPLNKFINNSSLFLEETLALGVPEPWKVFHLEIINLWQEQVAIYEAMIDYKADPLRAHIALEKMPDILTALTSLEKIFNERYWELKSNS